MRKIPTLKERTMAKNILVKLFNLGFNPNSRFGEFALNNVDQLNYLGIEWFSGMTKICLNSTYLPNWVIKIEGCLNGNYCQKEFENYIFALENNVEYFFAETYLIGEINNVKIYLQRKGTCEESTISERFCDYCCASASQNEEDWENIMDEMTDIDRIYAAFDSEYFPYAISKLEKFINCYQINDLHEGNYAIIEEEDEDGCLCYRTVIIDYSGY